MFQVITEKLVNLGVFNFFLPWIITTAIFYGMLRKSGMFQSQAINAILSLSISFFIWSYLSLGGVEIGGPLSVFFMQGTAIMLVLILGLVGASIFYPDFAGILKEQFASRNMIWVAIALFLTLFFTSGLSDVLIKPGAAEPGTMKHDIDILVTIIAALIILTLILVGSIRLGGK